MTSLCMATFEKRKSTQHPSSTGCGSLAQSHANLSHQQFCAMPLSTFPPSTAFGIHIFLSFVHILLASSQSLCLALRSLSARPRTPAFSALSALGSHTYRASNRSCTSARSSLFVGSCVAHCGRDGTHAPRRRRRVPGTCNHADRAR